MSVKEEARRRAGYCCEECGRRGRTEIHHIIPVFFAKEIPWLSPSIISSLANCKVLCPSCHLDADYETQHMSQEELICLAQAVLGVAQGFMAFA